MPPHSHELPDDPRAQRSYRALMESIGSLVDTLPIHDITITRIVAAAGLSRPTFYQYFDDVAAALQYAALYRLETSVPLITDDGPGPFGHLPLGERLQSTGVVVMTHLHESRAFYLSILESAPSTLFFDELVDRAFTRLLPEVLQGGSLESQSVYEDMKYVLAGGCVWMTVRWLRGDLVATPEELSERLAAVLLAIGTPTLKPETR